ncbi:hypothetical protein [Lysinibacillus pakistanensis]|uniref:Transcription initiation factor TFIIIB n=1 Tax=Lysinibacillus pakistanensis TaxID=759811 RepID=A0AAX3WQH3_9BACI|nr:hypothetical protein [Lysinibacillus pakistanensis]MDM5233797.1 hypothetical protein [Lysinibacillus pakistanensis]QGG51820.1 hypothetical protein GDS87_13105 [Lysinibacillus pakistanensis]WHY44415.1 hypothetical protein QNH22_13845 [Lysinibacillus pakistanensis]WHY49424.1 hypothetical protein QNH24_13825 [Lysinibacillus pakistanensis]
MENDKLICKLCGSDTFTQGELGGAYANVRPVDSVSIFSSSPLILSICTNCGEVASMKVKKLDKFK